MHLIKIQKNILKKYQNEKTNYAKLGRNRSPSGWELGPLAPGLEGVWGGLGPLPPRVPKVPSSATLTGMLPEER